MNIPLRKFLRYHRDHHVLCLPSPFFILLYGYSRKSICKDHSNMVASSVACSWVGQSGAPKLKRREKSAVGLPQDGLFFERGLISSKHMIFFFQVLVPFSPLLPLVLGVTTFLSILAPKFYPLKFLSDLITTFPYSFYETHSLPPQ